MPKAKLRVWDPAENMETEAQIAHYLEAMAEDRDPKLLSAALGHVVRALGANQIIERTGIARENLFDALNDKDHSDFDALMEIVRALQPRLEDKAAEVKKRESA